MKKFYQLLLLSLIFLGSSTALSQIEQSKWVLTATIPEDSVDHAQLIFADNLHGYLYGAKHVPDGVNETYKEIVLYRTIDGGATWNKIDLHTVFGGDTLLYDYHYSHDSYILRFDAPSPTTCVFSNASAGHYSHDTLIFYRSTDNGTTWTSIRTAPTTTRGEFMIEAMPHDKNVIALKYNNFREVRDGSNGKFNYSTDGGSSFTDSRWDSILLKNICYGGFGPEGIFHTVNNHYFDYSNDSTWIVIASDTNNASSTDSTRPYSLTTILSRDKGNHWQAYHNIIPHFPSNIGELYFANEQCIRGTPYIYMFTSNGRDEGGRAFGTGINWGFPHYGVNFIYSSDYGQTWGVDTSFSKNRRGYEPVAPEEVWCTITPHDSADNLTPTSWIAHTTNSGTSWNIDSTSLFNDGYYDARVITFSDKDHGWIYAQTMDRKKVAIFKYNGSNSGVEIHSVFSKIYIHYTINPNPSSTETSIQLAEGSVINNVEIYDVLGRKSICPYEIESNKFSVILHINGLQSGCYLAHISIQNGDSMVPFIVQH